MTVSCVQVHGICLLLLILLKVGQSVLVMMYRWLTQPALTRGQLIKGPGVGVDGTSGPQGITQRVKAEGQAALTLR